MELKHAFYTTPTLLGTLLVQIIALVLLVVFISGCGVTGVKPLTGTTLPMPINHTDTLADLRQEVATLQTEISACTEKDTAKKQFLETRLERILAAIEKKESAAVSYGETPDEETWTDEPEPSQDESENEKRRARLDKMIERLIENPIQRWFWTFFPPILFVVLFVPVVISTVKSRKQYRRNKELLNDQMHGREHKSHE